MGDFKLIIPATYPLPEVSENGILFSMQPIQPSILVEVDKALLDRNPKAVYRELLKHPNERVREYAKICLNPPKVSSITYEID